MKPRIGGFSRFDLLTRIVNILTGGEKAHKFVDGWRAMGARWGELILVGRS
jgi:hypothetical protein